jgi:hypothetical protein
MRALMGYRLALLASFAVLVAVPLGACGKEIGDPCNLASDCSPNGDRICACSNCSGTDPTSDSKNGYCTIQGCDFGTCPSEAVCVRFFTGNFTNKPCTASAMVTGCSLDELCAVSGHCVPRSSEIRYCMLRCESDGDCRDGYECRTFSLMQAHGGEPLLPNDQIVTEGNATKFCAVKPSAAG